MPLSLSDLIIPISSKKACYGLFFQSKLYRKSRQRSSTTHQTHILKPTTHFLTPPSSIFVVLRHLIELLDTFMVKNLFSFLISEEEAFVCSIILFGRFMLLRLEKVFLKIRLAYRGYLLFRNRLESIHKGFVINYLVFK